jgi:hypothetical protein
MMVRRYVSLLTNMPGEKENKRDWQKIIFLGCLSLIVFNMAAILLFSFLIITGR